MPDMPKPKMGVRLITLGAAAALVAADQWIKLWMTELLADGGRVLAPGVLGLHYAKNTGISFSMFGDSKAVMLVISAVTCLVMLAGIVLLLLGKIGGPAPLAGAALILAGGMGNLLDRLLHGFVVDYIELLFMRFAIFNFADICISCGVAVVTAWVIWIEARQHKSKKAAP